jgi:hypothetical protein
VRRNTARNKARNTAPQYRLFFFLAFYAAKRAPRSQAKKNITRRRTYRKKNIMRARGRRFYGLGKPGPKTNWTRKANFAFSRFVVELDFVFVLGRAWIYFCASAKGGKLGRGSAKADGR